MLRAIALRALRKMFLPDSGRFVFRLRRSENGVRPEGFSRRYTAIALIGLAGLKPKESRWVLHGQDPGDVCDRLLEDLKITEDMGEVALTLWAARALKRPTWPRALHRLLSLQPHDGKWRTVEIAWALTALCLPAAEPANRRMAGAIAGRLLASFETASGLFPHWPGGAWRPRLRGHVSCFADQVYPILALSYYSRVCGQIEALWTAKRCARQICRLQSPEGQWGWHYDVRSGKIIEQYPVYSVHQDSMAPMALEALAQSGGGDYSEAIRRGLAWLEHSPEINESLIDSKADLIWRKVARREPGKLVRGVQAAVSRIHPTLRAPGVDFAFRPNRIDFETRPYHMGWILHAWRQAEVQIDEIDTAEPFQDVAILPQHRITA